VEEVAPGLRRWTARHEEWEEDVASLAAAPSCCRRRETCCSAPGVLPSHGAPVLSGAREALQRLLL
jgi:hypothetical protein